ncbi:MAG: DNA gyrase inhibitor YacG [Candidatus Acidiferrales bacterium]
MTAARCPICRKPTGSEKNSDFPFCSERCRVLDLGNWASEKYRISQPIFDESEFEGADHNSSPSDGDNHDDRENDDSRDHGR